MEKHSFDLSIAEDSLARKLSFSGGDAELGWAGGRSPFAGKLSLQHGRPTLPTSFSRLLSVLF